MSDDLVQAVDQHVSVDHPPQSGVPEIVAPEMLVTDLGYDLSYAVMMASPSCSAKSVKSLTFSVASGKS